MPHIDAENILQFRPIRRPPGGHPSLRRLLAIVRDIGRNNPDVLPDLVQALRVFVRPTTHD
jgi:hypothetical protein